MRKQVAWGVIWAMGGEHASSVSTVLSPQVPPGWGVPTLLCAWLPPPFTGAQPVLLLDKGLRGTLPPAARVQKAHSLPICSWGKSYTS